LGRADAIEADRRRATDRPLGRGSLPPREIGERAPVREVGARFCTVRNDCYCGCGDCEPARLRGAQPQLNRLRPAGSTSGPPFPVITGQKPGKRRGRESSGVDSPQSRWCNSKQRPVRVRPNLNGVRAGGSQQRAVREKATDLASADRLVSESNGVTRHFGPDIDQAVVRRRGQQSAGRVEGDGLQRAGCGRFR